MCECVPETCDDGAMPKALLIGHDVNVLPDPVYVGEDFHKHERRNKGSSLLG